MRAAPPAGGALPSGRAARAAGAAVPPAAGRLLERALRPADALFRRVYGSRWNPLHASGALAVLFLCVATASGLVLFLFYRIAEPYASVVAIQEQVWGGAWLRALHRYSADLTLVALVAHLLRKLALGQTWGPRALAWVSGVLLLGLVLLCGWTGLVMAWDTQGRLVAEEGARLLDLLPVFSEPISRLFSGVAPMTSAFFFMNLFLHVALPLGLVALLWLHVSRVARPKLFPPRAVAWFTLAALAVFSLLLPVPLLPPADLFAVPGEVATDIFYAFWLPLARNLPAGLHLALWLAGGALLLALPWLWRPRGAAISPSVVDPARCTGCDQCYQDCPYEAIAMVAREPPSALSLLVARVDPDLCVGCGICAGSCAPMGVGPEGRTGRDQLRQAEAFLERHRPAATDVVVLGCGHGGVAAHALAGDGALPWTRGCAGSIHTSVIELLLRRGAGGVLVLTCAESDCRFREGPKWLVERVWHDREAELRERVDKRRVAVASLAPGELAAARGALEVLRDRVRELAPPAPEPEPELDRECEVPDAAQVV